MQHAADIDLKTNPLKESKRTKYFTIVESVMYFSTRTRYNLFVVACALCSSVANPIQLQMAAAKYALRYLRVTANRRIVLSSDPWSALSVRWSEFWDWTKYCKEKWIRYSHKLWWCSNLNDKLFSGFGMIDQVGSQIYVHVRRQTEHRMAAKCVAWLVRSTGMHVIAST